MRRFEQLVQPMQFVKGVHSRKEFDKPGEQQRQAEARFPELVAESHLHLWKPGDPIPTKGRRFLIGVDTASLYDMRLLDDLDEALTAGRIRDDRLDVFQYWTECKTQEDIEQFFPGMELARIFHSPVVGLWENDILIKQASGALGRELLVEYYGLNRKPRTLFDRIVGALRPD
jgi:hypothetical protein